MDVWVNGDVLETAVSTLNTGVVFMYFNFSNSKFWQKLCEKKEQPHGKLYLA